ncbi:MAG: mechanosensitive ion channel family protein [Acidobacteriota bacterium]
MESILDVITQLIEQNTAAEWIAFLISFGVLLAVLSLVRRVVVSYFTRLADKTTTSVDDVLAQTLGKTRFLFLLIVAFWFAARSLTLPVPAAKFLNAVLLLAVFFQIGLWANNVLRYIVDHFVRLEIEDETSRVATTTALTFLGRLALWSLILLLTLENLGVDVTSLVTGLGIGGVAIALAAQNILGDLFASLSILFDKPFVVGDFIVIDTFMGTVEHIGLKTTRVRSVSGEQLIFSNNDLLRSRIKNFKRMQERRILFTIGVTYDTPLEKLKLIPEIIKEAIDREEEARFDRCHFKAYGDFALLFETVYWTLKPDYIVYMEIQQRINLFLYERFQQEGIEFAFPTQTIHLVTASSGSPAAN